MTDTKFVSMKQKAFKVFVVADFAILFFEYNKCCYEQFKNALSVCGHKILA